MATAKPGLEDHACFVQGLDISLCVCVCVRVCVCVWIESRREANFEYVTIA